MEAIHFLVNCRSSRLGFQQCVDLLRVSKYSLVLSVIPRGNQKLLLTGRQLEFWGFRQSATRILNLVIILQMLPRNSESIKTKFKAVALCKMKNVLFNIDCKTERTLSVIIQYQNLLLGTYSETCLERPLPWENTLTDHTFLAEGPRFQCNWTCH